MAKESVKPPIKSIKKRFVRLRRFAYRIAPKTRRTKIIATIIFLFVVFLIWLFWNIPLPHQLEKSQSVSTKIYDRKGALIYEIFADERRSPIKLEELPDFIKEATIAIEDKDFYKHGGFSITGILRAFYKTVFKRDVQGGSTLTQQLVKNTLLTPERTVRRKIREFFLSVIVEGRYSKDEILELYLNLIPYGSTAYGIEAASELYFGKSAKDLNLSEASLLAGLLASPSRYSPFGSHPEFAFDRQKTVLRRMVEDGYITQEEADKALEVKLEFAKQADHLKAPHFALLVKELLSEEYGESVVEKGGLRVTTTLDLDLQELAQEAVSSEVAKLTNLDVGNGAALVTYPATGEILAMVGSKDYFASDEDGKVNIIFAKRQPGSSIKPLNYALAIRDKKITASTPLADIPSCFTVLGQEPYCPGNYDGAFHGSIQVRNALGNSYNVPAVRVLALNGMEEFVEFAKSMGISTFEDASNYGLSLTLGGGEVRPYDMAVAFGVFANQGIKEDLITVLKVTDWTGKTLFESKKEPLNGPRVLDANTAFIISHILSDNNARTDAFGATSFLNVRGHPEVSVKTGTTNDRRDNWTIGYSKHAVALSWVGNNDNTPMKGAVSGVSGASPIWNKVMRGVLDKADKGYYHESDKGPGWMRPTSEVVGVNICANTGFLPNDATADCPQRFEYFIEDTIPQDGARRQDIPFDKVKNEYLTGSETDVEMQNHLVVNDPLGTIICLTCPFPMGQVTIRYPIRRN